MSKAITGGWIGPLCAAAAALAISGTTYMICRPRKHRRLRRERLTTSTSVSEWDVEQVLGWLASLGVSSQTMKCFEENDIDGPALLLLEEADIPKLAPKMRDVVHIRDGLRNLRGGSAHEAIMPQDKQQSVPPKQEERHSGAHEDLFMVLLQEADAIRTLMESQDFQNARPEWQVEVRQACAQRFASLLEEVRKLPSELRNKLEPVMARLHASVTSNTTTDSLQNTSQMTPTPALEQQLKSLHNMVDDFARVLDEASAESYDSPLMDELCEQVRAQLNRVAAAACRLPPQYGEPLKAKCDNVLNQLQKKLSKPPAESTSGPSLNVQGSVAPDISRKAPDFDNVLQQLRSMFSELKTSVMKDSDIERRLQRLASMKESLAVVTREVSTWKDTGKSAAIGDVINKVLLMVEQVEALSQEELALSNRDSGHSAAPVEGEQALKAGTEASGRGVDVSYVVASLQSIVQVLRSEEMLLAPGEVQLQMVNKLGKKLAELHKWMEDAPRDETNLQVMAMIEAAQDLISGVAGAVKGSSSQEENESSLPQARLGSQADTTRDPAVQLGEQQPGVEANDMDDAIVFLEKIFEYIDSDALDALPPEEQRKVALYHLDRLGQIERKCMESGQQRQLLDLIGHIRNILERKTRQEAEEEAPSGQLFHRCSTCLADIKKILDSESFTGADAAKKRSFALYLMPQVQKVMTSMTHLSPYEMSAIVHLITPINDVLYAAASNPGAAVASAGVNTVNPLELIANMENMKNVLESTEFGNAPTQQKHLIVGKLLMDLNEVQEQCLSLGDAAAPVLPVVQQMRGQLQYLSEATRTEEGEERPSNIHITSRVPQHINPANRFEGDNEDESSGDDDSGDEGGTDEVSGGEGDGLRAMQRERRRLFKSVKDITLRLRRANEENFVMSLEELEPLRSLLVAVDSVGLFSDEEVRLYGAFKTELGYALQKAYGSGSNVYAQDNRLPNSSQYQGLPTSNRIDGNVFTGGLPDASHMHRTPHNDSPSAVQYQQESTAPTTLELRQMLQEALQRVRQNPPRNEEDLRLYLPLLERVQQAGDQVPKELLLGFQELQDALISAVRPDSVAEGTLAQQDHSAEAQPSDDDYAESVSDAEATVSRLLLDMSIRLREGSASDEVLDQFSIMLDCLESRRFGESFRDAIESVRQQIELQRVVNRNNELESSSDEEGDEDVQVFRSGKGVCVGDEEGALSPDEAVGVKVETGDAANAAPEILEQAEVVPETSMPPNQEGETTRSRRRRPRRQNKSKSTAADKPCFLEKLPKNTVPGGTKAELVLLPRIEKRVASEEQHFIENTTLSDIQNISKVILHLQSSPIVRGDESLKARVDRLKGVFARQLIAFKGSDQQSIAVRSGLRLQCYDSVVSGNDIRTLVICTEKEVESAAVELRSEELLKLLTEGKAVEATVSKDIEEEWKGRSTAIIFFDAPRAAGTTLCEILMLQEVLTCRYGFDVYVAGYADPSKVESLLAEVNSSGAKRLFLYFVTDACSFATPSAINFRNGSTVAYKAILNMVSCVDRVVLGHCQPLRLNVVSYLSADSDAEVEVSSLLSVVLTEEAAAEMRPTRCWLYDGLLTPAITELLSLDEERVLCPEDLVMYVVTALSSHTIDFGSFMEGGSHGMGFLSPVECE